MIPSVNFHLWEPCNMRCKFCFATFQDVKVNLPKGHLPKEEAIKVVKQLAQIGFEKITFAGGEPTLCPWLSDLISTATDAGMTTMIVTNGSALTDAFLEKNKTKLDWIAVSVDSLLEKTNIETGRAISGASPLTLEYYKDIATKIKQYGYGLKINTVVSSKNYSEDLSSFIEFAKPKRWKVFQVLPIKGQNDAEIENFIITNHQFENFLSTHEQLKNHTQIVPESNEQIKGSYAMVDPAGRFYDNSEGKHNYSKPILKIGVKEAIKQVNYSLAKFEERGGNYDWVKHKVPYTRITLSGEVASGKSTVGKLLAEKLNYEFTSIGNKTRDKAKQRNMSIVDFQIECINNPSMDISIDQDFAKECNEKQNLVIDYRLGYKFIQNSYNIYLQITEEKSIERLRSAGRENEDHTTIRKRNEAFRQQFISAYNEDYTLAANYDLVIDVEKHATPVTIVDTIINQLNQL